MKSVSHGSSNTSYQRPTWGTSLMWSLILLLGSPVTTFLHFLLALCGGQWTWHNKGRYTFFRPAPRSLSSLLACLRKTTVTISRCCYRCFVDRISHQPPSSPYSTCIYYWCEPREAVLELQPSFPGRGGGDACWNKISWAIFSEPKYFWTELYLKKCQKKV